MFGIIPAAGKGLRFGEISKRYPKPILPFENKPIIIHNIELMLEAGCDPIYIVVNHGSDKIKELLDFYSIPQVKIVHYYKDDGPAGSIGAALKEHKSDDDFLVLLSDVIPERHAMLNLIRHAKQKTSFVTYSKVPDYERWCLVYPEGTFVKYFEDKPKKKPKRPNPAEKCFYALNGCYYFLSSDKFYDGLRYMQEMERFGEFQISHAITAYMQEDQNVFCCEMPVKDFGTIGEFLQNRNVRICRGFNQISIEPDRVVKSSSKNAEKVYREFAYLQNVPYEVAPHFPRVYSHGHGGDGNSLLPGFWYSMEVMRMQNLREMYVFYNNDNHLWEKIIDSLIELIYKFRNIETHPGDCITEIIKKTKERGNHNPLLIQTMQEHKWSEMAHIKSFFHGDFCLGNIFYDEPSSFVRCLDPRGERYGTVLYDLAKLMHSFVGKFDIVDCEMYILNENKVYLYNRGKRDISKHFMESLKFQFGPEVFADVVLLTASLFSSMIPLHYHNPTNQKIFRVLHEIFLEAYLNKTVPFVPDVLEIV